MLQLCFTGLHGDAEFFYDRFNPYAPWLKKNPEILPYEY
jgi:hypothetical protein